MSELRRVVSPVLSTPVVGITPLSARARSDSPIGPHRYLVVYRNAVIPDEAEFRAAAAGAGLLQRNDHFGIQTVQSAESKTSALPRSLSLRQDDDAIVGNDWPPPNVEYVSRSRRHSHLNIRPVVIAVNLGEVEGKIGDNIGVVLIDTAI